MYGVTFLPFDVKMAVAEAQQDRTGPTIARFLKFCYTYDPSGRRYFVDITRVAEVLTIVLALGFGVVIAESNGRYAKLGGVSAKQDGAHSPLRGSVALSFSKLAHAR